MNQLLIWYGSFLLLAKGLMHTLHGPNSFQKKKDVGENREGIGKEMREGK